MAGSPRLYRHQDSNGIISSAIVDLFHGNQRIRSMAQTENEAITCLRASVYE